MDKQSYKEMLADEITKVSELEKEINRLQVLVTKYQVENAGYRDRLIELGENLKKQKGQMKKSKKTQPILMYDGEKKYTFLNVTIWDCLKFWLITKLSGTDLDK